MKSEVYGKFVKGHWVESPAKILYEGRFRIISEFEEDHIHLDDGTVIRDNEIINLPLGLKISKYSEKNTIKRLSRLFRKFK